MSELEEINNITYNILGNLLFKMIPEYKLVYEEVKPSTKLGNYEFMNDFALYLVLEINKNINSNFVVNSFDYINEIGNSYNLEVLNILKVGILEILYTSDVNRDLVLSHLSDVNKRSFNSFSKFYH